MSITTSITWTDATWNIARGCTKVDEDCKFCYMYRDSMSSTRYDPLQVVRTKTVFDMPLRYKETVSQSWHGKPLIFTCSLTDFFHEGCDSFRDEAWDIIRKCPHLIFQILTKRPERIMQCLPSFWKEIEGRIWMGTSCGGPNGYERIVELSWLDIECIKFLSLEPLHGEILLTTITKEVNGIPFHVLPAFDWVIVGGESGNDIGKYRYRSCELQWIEKIVVDCQRNQIPVFVKQMGTYLSKQLKMSDRHGGNIEEFPEPLRIREFPKGRIY